MRLPLDFGTSLSLTAFAVVALWGCCQPPKPSLPHPDMAVPRTFQCSEIDAAACCYTQEERGLAGEDDFQAGNPHSPIWSPDDGCPCEEFGENCPPECCITD